MFYLWLCVVSHFQILKEVSALGLGSDLEHVKPFHNEDPDSVLITEDYPTNYDDNDDNDGLVDKDKEEVVDAEADNDNNDKEYDPIKTHKSSRPNSAAVAPESGAGAVPADPAQYQPPPMDVEDVLT